MSKDIDREESAARIVQSKYFSTHFAMDESLTDFQEPKKLAGPKNPTKTKPDKPKRAPKRIRGQKDIRTALKSKKNELESYAKDFDKVCKHAGLDVDSEQLQLAIALSKSLQQSESASGDSPETSQSNSQDRVGKIRTTLLEYGFKVPDIKITTSKRLKKRKKYKLLETSEEVKKQNISDKYFQVLFQNSNLSQSFENNDTDFSLIHLYHLATNATYSILKNKDTFYVGNLLEKSTSTGNLLRDWSEIPGRPVSPKLCEPLNMNFSEIECSQEELDIVLSGSLKNCKNVIKSKENYISESESELKLIERRELVSINHLDNSPVILIEKKNMTPKRDNKTLSYKETEVIDLAEAKDINVPTKPIVDEIIDLNEPLETVDKHRSLSPDLFDDEPSALEDPTKADSQETESPLMDILITVPAINNVMDLTACNNTLNENHSISLYPTLQLSQNTNVTRRFNDLMEITECVEVQCLDTKTLTSQDLTKKKCNDFMEITNCVENVEHPLFIEGDIDLTQSPENQKLSEANDVDQINVAKFSTNIPITELDYDQKNIDINGSETQNPIIEKLREDIAVASECNIDLTGSPEVNKFNDTDVNVADKSIERLDLTQSSNTSDELPFVSLKTNKRNDNELNQSVDKTVLIDPEEYEAITKSADDVQDKEVLDLTQNILHDEKNHNLQDPQNNEIGLEKEAQNNVSLKQPEDILDLTQEIAVISRLNSRTSEPNVSFFEEYVHNHSDNTDFQEQINPSNKILSLDVDTDTIPKYSASPNYNTSNQHKDISNHDENNDIDLTQNDDSLEGFSKDLSNKGSTNKCFSVESDNDSDTTIELVMGKGSQSDIDLTQNSESEELSQGSHNKNSSKNDRSINQENDVDSDASIDMQIIKSSQRCSSLGKKDDVSIDYDEVYDNLLNKSSNTQNSKSLSKSASEHLGNVSNKSKDISNCSQNSEVFVISDNELDYSMHKSKLEKPVDNFLIGGLSIMDELSGLGSFRRSTNIENNSAVANTNSEPTNSLIEIVDDKPIEIEHLRKTPVKHKRVNELATPQKPSCSGIHSIMTPSNSEYQIKTIAVTPMPNYETMSLAEIHEELENFGVKPFKRKRAIQLLTHIYNQTHPIVEAYSEDESPSKRQKTTDNSYSPQKDSPTKLPVRNILSPKKTAKSPTKNLESKKCSRNVSQKGKEIDTASEESNKRRNHVEGVQSDDINYEVNEQPIIKEVVCSPDDWVFQKREKAKVHSCRVPLHIAFHNYVSSRRELREDILCYEPINIDDVHKDLVEYGHRYDPKDLLKFMDKKCITVKTTDNDTRNQKR